MEIKASVLFCGDRRESSSSFSSSSSKRMNGEDVQLSRPAAHECRNIPSRDTFPSSSSLCARPFPFFNALVSLVFYVYEKLPNHGDENSRQLGEFVMRPTERKKRNFFFPRPQLLLLFLFRVTLINLSTETQSREMSDGISRCACAVTNFRLSYNTVPYLYIIILKEEEEKNKITRWKILHTTNWNERRGSWCVMSLFYPLAGRLRPTV